MLKVVKGNKHHQKYISPNALVLTVAGLFAVEVIMKYLSHQAKHHPRKSHSLLLGTQCEVWMKNSMHGLTDKKLLSVC